MEWYYSLMLHLSPLKRIWLIKVIKNNKIGQENKENKQESVKYGRSVEIVKSCSLKYLWMLHKCRLDKE